MKTLNLIIAQVLLFFFVHSQSSLADTVSLVDKINKATASSTNADIIKFNGELFVNVEQGLSLYNESTDRIEVIKDAQTHVSITTPSRFYAHDSNLYFLNIADDKIVVRAFNEAEKSAVIITSLTFENTWIETLEIEDVKFIGNKLFISTWLDDGENSVYYFIHEVDLQNGSSKILPLESGYFKQSGLFVVQDTLYFTARSAINNSSKIYSYTLNSPKAIELKSFQNSANILASNENSIVFETQNLDGLDKKIYRYNNDTEISELIFYSNGIYQPSSVLLTNDFFYYFSKHEESAPELFAYDFAKKRSSKLTSFGVTESENKLFPWSDVEIKLVNNSLYFTYGFKLHNYGFRKVYNLNLLDNSIYEIEPYSNSGTNDVSKIYSADNSLYALVSDGKLGKEWFKFDNNHKKLVSVKDFNIAYEATAPKCYSLHGDVTYFIASNNNLFKEDSSSAIYKYSGENASLVFDLNKEIFRGIISGCPVYIDDNAYFFYKTTPDSYAVSLASFSLKDFKFSKIQLDNFLEPNSNDEILKHLNKLYYISKEGIYLYQNGLKKYHKIIKKSGKLHLLLKNYFSFLKTN
ncbi:hypothetical protein NI389_20100 (plasmid) [Pseudoalteromonas xiamenensis]|uniref:hypothetical protein n=1 Tax=Pseudoalteromonas xiamenensis TaxID=882626 RepID=UPI0027E47F2E|nr:hypothetical protein [Pseudoalteromonas xiamenensis]WMN62103.1 hypothetical protein NI389_20100 [Pseudoalteromonas xiamenensis]